MIVSTGGCSTKPGDADALVEDLYGRYWRYLVNYISQRLSDPHQAEEIVQETMLRAWRHADKLDPEQGSVKAWLCRVAHNIMVDRIRHKRARPAEVDETTAPQDAYLRADHSSDVVSSVDVQRAIARLQPGHRAVLYLVYFAGRTCAEAAVMLGVPVGTVHSRLHYALRHLRAIFGHNRAGYG
jgi:RNA polymerase sigma-70 factor (ECF subfamily)